MENQRATVSRRRLTHTEMENQREWTFPNVSLPIIFFDSYIEVNIDNILVYPFLLFHNFKTLISQKLGIPPHQILTYLVRWKNARSSPEICFKVPIDESSDFTAITKDRDCYVLAILNAPRTNRLLCKGERGKAIVLETEVIVLEKEYLKRFPTNAFNVNVPVPARWRHWNYESQLHKWELAYTPLKEVESKMETATSSEMGAAAVKVLVCEECDVAKKEGRLADFHPCLLDPVVVGFRSKVGPIQWPLKKLLEA